MAFCAFFETSPANVCSAAMVKGVVSALSFKVSTRQTLEDVKCDLRYGHERVGYTEAALCKALHRNYRWFEWGKGHAEKREYGDGKLYPFHDVLWID